jgi:hypothetical protein
MQVKIDLEDSRHQRKEKFLEISEDKIEKYETESYVIRERSQIKLFIN